MRYRIIFLAPVEVEVDVEDLDEAEAAADLIEENHPDVITLICIEPLEE